VGAGEEFGKKIWRLPLAKLYHFHKEDVAFVIDCLIKLGKIEYKLTVRRNRMFIVK